MLVSGTIVSVSAEISVFIGAEWCHTFSIASVLYHHHPSMMYDRPLKQSFAAFVHFFEIRWPHNGSWRSLTRFSGSVTKTNRIVVDAQDMTLTAPNCHQTTANSTRGISETNGHVVLAGEGNERGWSTCERARNLHRGGNFIKHGGRV